jgi:hypothetical protein
MAQIKNIILEKYKDELQNIITEYFKNAEITFHECNNILQKWNYENMKLDNEAFIYFSFHKKDNKLFYIGYTTRTLRTRFNNKIQANEFRLKLFDDYYKKEFCKKNISLKEFDDTIISKAIEDNVIIYYLSILCKENLTKNSISKELEQHKEKIKKEIKKENKIPNSL